MFLSGCSGNATLRATHTIRRLGFVAAGYDTVCAERRGEHVGHRASAIAVAKRAEVQAVPLSIGQF